MRNGKKYCSYALKVLGRKSDKGQILNLIHMQLSRKKPIVSWKPTHISICTTDRCNLSCKMCPTHSKSIPKDYVHSHRRTPDMSLDLFRYVLDLFPRAIRAVLIGTGEPLLNPNFFNMVEECVKRKMIANTCSNGFGINRYKDSILSSGLEKIIISVNGHTGEEFHRMTGNSEEIYPIILRNVKELVKERNKRNSKLKIELSFIVDSFNFRFMDQMIQLGDNLGAELVSLIPFLPLPYPGYTPEERCLLADNQEVIRKLCRLMPIKFRCDVEYPFLLSNSLKNRKVCRWPFSQLRVDGEGNIGGCGVALLNTRGNGKVYDKDPWNNRYFRDLRNRHLNGDLFWPCRFCTESMGVEPGQAIKHRCYS